MAAGWVWWHMPSVPTLMGQNRLISLEFQARVVYNSEFQTSRSHTVRPGIVEEGVERL